MFESAFWGLSEVLWGIFTLSRLVNRPLFTALWQRKSIPKHLSAKLKIILKQILSERIAYFLSLLQTIKAVSKPIAMDIILALSLKTAFLRYKINLGFTFRVCLGQLDLGFTTPLKAMATPSIWMAELSPTRALCILSYQLYCHLI